MEKAKRAILDSGKSCQEIASQLGMTYLTLWRILNGKRKRVPVEFISKVAMLLGKSPNELIDDYPENPMSSPRPGSRQGCGD